MAKKEQHAPEEELLVLHEKWVRAAREHLREIILVSILLVLAACLWAGFNYYRSSRENKASLLYAQALMAKDQAQREKALKDLIKRYDGTSAALEAHLSLYEIYLQEKKFDQALKELSYLQKKAHKPWKAFLDLGVGYLKEDQNHLQEAEKNYLQAVKAQIGLEEIAYLDLARVAELEGNYQAAVKYYEEFLGRKPQGPILDFVQVRLSKLEEKISEKKDQEG